MEEMNTRVLRITEAKDNAIFVYEEIENKLLGWVHVFGKYLIELEYAEIGGLNIDCNARRQGIGLKLMGKCEIGAIENGYQEIKLRPGEQRKEAHKFYKKIGCDKIKSQQLFLLKL
ncbi:GNAT family N-acetyltransferase [Cytobacillus oceanisediminis]|uniref:GNAT family N-acetyltransferase n=1 Tax=Cytobacillus oceanisediminis TaxID=665099 RepID=UPI001CCC71A4|nr:GNAT family N-acetyltransferase [Cytobacillus oceanisediminis]MBQ6446521.1 GNAT family N-acetyltransferase [Bacillus sp. (in: firmicutes)]MBZ9535272.1 GNAT family N-acetyltransferase [Cytobacillus oceanisediminis]